MLNLRIYLNRKCPKVMEVSKTFSQTIISDSGFFKAQKTFTTIALRPGKHFTGGHPLFYKVYHYCIFVIGAFTFFFFRLPIQMRPHGVLGEPDSIEFTWLLVRHGVILHAIRVKYLLKLNFKIALCTYKHITVVIKEEMYPKTNYA